MTRRASRCSTCPFHNAGDAYKAQCAPMPAADWPCHDEDLHGNDQTVQCRGHWEAQKKFLPAPAA